MTLNLSFATWDHDRAAPLHEGLVDIPGVRLDTHYATTGELFPLAVGDAPYDITEMSFSSYIIQCSRDEGEYIALPVFLSRAFRHGAIYVRSGSPFKTPKDLEGRIVGLPEYGMTMAIWVRGLMADDYGVDLSKLTYRTAGINEPGRVERLRIDLPTEYDLKPLPFGQTLNQALLDGELDAVISAAPPKAFSDGTSSIVRMLEPLADPERAYFQRTGILPIMHVVGVRRTIAEEYPDLCAKIHQTFVKARRLAMDRIKSVAEGSANRMMSPWFADAYEQAVRTMGHDYWPYGVEDNAASLDAMVRYMNDQHLMARPVTLDELFHPSTTKLAGT